MALQMQEETIVAKALRLVQLRHKEMPTVDAYVSCIRQLEFLLATLRGETPMDRPKLRTIKVGHYAMHEFEETDPELARKLKDAQHIASQMGDGLKVR